MIRHLNFLLWALALGLPAHAANNFSRAPEDSAAKSPWPEANESSHGNLMKLDSNYQQALKFAPILWFANPEQYFPTLPFFSAFDRRDNNKKNGRDFHDPDEIAPEDSIKKGYARWDYLHAWYQALSEAAKKSQAAVFYKIREIKAGDLWKILDSDEQFWDRLQKRLNKNHEKITSYFKTAEKLEVYEYYFYFINDAGLQGHREDLECVFIFVPQKKDLNFRIAVGIGHLNNTPNNVLFYFTDEMPEKAKYNEHLHFLVELGGHSHAPDFDVNGRFDPGVDANWHMEYLWGTRDMQAIYGGGYTGRYEAWMTLPRSAKTDSNKVFPPDSDITKPHHYVYKLLPAEEFKKLDSWLDQYEKTPGAKDSLRTSLLQRFSVRLKNMGFEAEGLAESPSNGSNVPAGSIDEKANLDRLLLWRRDLIDPLKPSLRRQYGASFWLNRKFLSGPNYSEARFALLVRPSYGKSSPVGAFEIHAGRTASLTKRSRNLFAVFYDTYYTPLFNALSFYGNISKLDKPSTWNVGLGVSVVPPFEFRGYRILRHFSLRLGLQYEFMKEFKRGHPLLNLDLGIHRHPIPTTRLPYARSRQQKHQIWKHENYENKPDRVFKRHLYRPRPPGGLGLWAHVALQRKPAPEFRVAWLVPPEIAPIKLSGVLEIQAGPRFSSDVNDQGLTLALYYHNFYGRLLSWYVNAPSWTWIRRQPDLSYFSFGGGISIKPPAFTTRAKSVFHWVQLRLGLRSDINRRSIELTHPRFELQLGVHY